MSLLKDLNSALTTAVETAYSLLRLAAGFSLVRLPRGLRQSQDCLVLGNGPSLKPMLQDIAARRGALDTFCVNFFANDPHYTQIQPRHYVLLDPLFWLNGLPAEVTAKKRELFNRLFQTDWPMNLYVPSQARGALKGYQSPKVRVIYYNRTPVIGFRHFRHLCYRLNLGMPVPQNVLVATLFLAIQLGYRKAFILGADHSWHQELAVGQDNVLYVKQFHFNEDDVVLTPFYKPGNKETFRVHEIFQAWSRVFRSYFHLQCYARQAGTTIINSCPGSFIDAFERGSVELPGPSDASQA